LKKLIISTLLSLSLITVTTVKSMQADVNENQSEIKTIVVAANKSGNNEKSRVYQLTDQKMYKTNRTMATFSNNHLNHWWGQLVEINGENWWKVGENQYFKTSRVNVINADSMKEHGLSISNYVNFNGKNGVSMIDES